MLNQYPDFDVKHVFSTFETGRLNGYDVMIMESSRKREILEDMFRQCVKQGLDVNEYQYAIYEQAGFSPQDLLETDVLILKEKVERMANCGG